jgi:uncharacterized Zn finger protein
MKGNNLNNIMEEIMNNDEMLSRVLAGEVNTVIEEVQRKLGVELTEAQRNIIIKNLSEV